MVLDGLEADVYLHYRNKYPSYLMHSWHRVSAKSTFFDAMHLLLLLLVCIINFDNYMHRNLMQCDMMANTMFIIFLTTIVLGQLDITFS